MEFDFLVIEFILSAFPHEPTSDQFFDKVQWESYFQLGQFIGAEVLGDNELVSFSNKTKKAYSIEDLIAHFDDHIPLFKDKVVQKIEPKEVKVAPRGIPSEDIVEPAEVVSEPTVEAESPASDVAQKEPEPKAEKVVLGEEVQYKM